MQSKARNSHKQNLSMQLAKETAQIWALSLLATSASERSARQREREGKRGGKGGRRRKERRNRLGRSERKGQRRIVDEREEEGAKMNTHTHTHPDVFGVTLQYIVKCLLT